MKALIRNTGETVYETDNIEGIDVLILRDNGEGGLLEKVRVIGIALRHDHVIGVRHMVNDGGVAPHAHVHHLMREGDMGGPVVGKLHPQRTDHILLAQCFAPHIGGHNARILLIVDMERMQLPILCDKGDMRLDEARHPASYPSDGGDTGTLYLDIVRAMVNVTDIAFKLEIYPLHVRDTQFNHIKSFYALLAI